MVSLEELSKHLVGLGLELRRGDLAALVERLGSGGGSTIGCVGLEELARFAAGADDAGVSFEGRLLGELRDALRAFFRRSGDAVPDLAAAFDELDLNGSGAVDAQELQVSFISKSCK